MIRREYSAGAVKFSFWFMEFKTMINLLSEGMTFDEIKQKNKNENIFGAPTPLRAGQIFNTVSARIKSLDESFYSDHVKMYQNTSIYCLFDSGKQNGFKALIYMNRYTADTIGNVRVDYLHRIQRVYESEIGRMQDTIDNSKNSREVSLATKRKEKLQKQLKECREYDEKIGHMALARIELDLDDGVKVKPQSAVRHRWQVL